MLLLPCLDNLPTGERIKYTDKELPLLDVPEKKQERIKEIKLRLRAYGVSEVVVNDRERLWTLLLFDS